LWQDEKNSFTSRERFLRSGVSKLDGGFFNSLFIHLFPRYASGVGDNARRAGFLSIVLARGSETFRIYRNAPGGTTRGTHVRVKALPQTWSFCESQMRALVSILLFHAFRPGGFRKAKS
jgi:hypothetical protein